MVADTGLLLGRISFLRQATWARNKALELQCHQRKVCYTREQPARRFSTKIHEAFVKYTVSGYFILSNLSVSLFACLFFSLLLFHNIGFRCTISLKIAGKGGTRWSITFNNPFSALIIPNTSYIGTGFFFYQSTWYRGAYLEMVSVPEWNLE